MRKLLIGTALLAVAASGAVAAPGHGPDKAHKDAPGHEQPKARGNAPDHAEKARADKAPAPKQQAHRSEPSHDARSAPRTEPRRAADNRRNDDRPPAQPVAQRQAEPDRRADQARHDQARHDQDRVIGERREAAERRARIARDRTVDARRAAARERSQVASRQIDNDRIYRIYRYNHGPLDGCPPGLRKKHNGCLPPGQAKKLYERRVAWSRPAYYGYRDWNDGRYLYDDGYLLRLNDSGGVLGYLPLLGGALSIGNPWPSYYEPVQVSDYYVDYYNLGPRGGYRYADDVLYRVDPQDSAITSIAALLTGDQFNVGQPMPSGYDVYNVPYAYQDRYYDTPDANYRYADGYVYQVDPTTQLIQAAIELLI